MAAHADRWRGGLGKWIIRVSPVLDGADPAGNLADRRMVQVQQSHAVPAGHDQRSRRENSRLGQGFRRGTRYFLRQQRRAHGIPNLLSGGPESRHRPVVELWTALACLRPRRHFDDPVDGVVSPPYLPPIKTPPW